MECPSAFGCCPFTVVTIVGHVLGFSRHPAESVSAVQPRVIRTLHVPIVPQCNQWSLFAERRASLCHIPDPCFSFPAFPPRPVFALTRGPLPSTYRPQITLVGARLSDERRNLHHDYYLHCRPHSVHRIQQRLPTSQPPRSKPLGSGCRVLQPFHRRMTTFRRYKVDEDGMLVARTRNPGCDSYVPLNSSHTYYLADAANVSRQKPYEHPQKSFIAQPGNQDALRTSRGDSLKAEVDGAASS